MKFWKESLKGTRMLPCLQDLHNFLPLRGTESVDWHLLPVKVFPAHYPKKKKGTTMPLTEVILDFNTLRGTKPQILTP